MQFKRRIGPAPAPGAHFAAGSPTSSGANGCPDIWELESGDFAIIGRKAEASLLQNLPSTASMESDEAMVTVPRSLLINAVADLRELASAE